MFRYSQEIRLDSTYNNNNNNNEVYGKYQKFSDSDIYDQGIQKVYVSPEITNVKKIQILHIPEDVVDINSCVKFIIKRNGVKGNFEVNVENPLGVISNIPLCLEVIDPERFGVNYTPVHEGFHKFHIKCNGVDLPKSPYVIFAENSSDTPIITHRTRLPVFHSDASLVKCCGNGLHKIQLNKRNEFIIDGSTAGNNILFVGICGPLGHCEEVTIKHMGRNLYKVTYKVQDPGEYLIAAKWGDDHINGSPFQLATD